jgi:hypothetical protein
MLQKLSYINLIFAIIYVLIYLRSGTFQSTSGILVVIIFNWLFIRAYQQDHYKWSILHYATGLWSLYFIGTILYGVINIIKVSIESDFISNDTIINLSTSVLFSASVLLHLIGYWKVNR